MIYYAAAIIVIGSGINIGIRRQERGDVIVMLIFFRAVVAVVVIRGILLPIRSFSIVDSRPRHLWMQLGLHVTCRCRLDFMCNKRYVLEYSINKGTWINLAFVELTSVRRGVS